MASLTDRIRQDRADNVEGKSRAILAWFRLAQACRRGETALPRPLERLVDRAYRGATAWWMATEIHPDVEAGPRLRLFHSHAIVVNPGARLGADCTLRAGVCIGNVTDRDGVDGPAPVLGDRVDIGVGALVIGAVTVGDDVRIGAGAVVVHDVPSGATVVGNPARSL